MVEADSRGALSAARVDDQEARLTAVGEGDGGDDASREKDWAEAPVGDGDPARLRREGPARRELLPEEEFAGIERINWSLGGRFERAGHLAIRSNGRHSFDGPTNSFEVELLVDDSLVLCFIDGEYKGSYRTPDGSAIEGYVGFAMSRGAVRIAGATLQRLDRASAAGLLGRLPRALDLEEVEVPNFANLSGVPVEGLPRSQNGVFAVWLPLPELDEEDPGEAWRQLERSTSASLAAC